MSFFSQLSHGGMARMKGFGGATRDLVADIQLRVAGNILDSSVSNWDYYSQTSDIQVTGSAGAEALVRMRLESDNGYSVGEFVIRVGDTFTYQRQSHNSGYIASSLVTGSVPNSIPSYSPRMFMMSGCKAPTACNSGGSAGYPQGGRGGGGGSCGGRQGWGGGGGGCGGTTWGYQSGSGGQHGQYYPGPGANSYQGGFLSYGSGGTFWFTSRGSSPGGYGYYGGGGGGGGWTGGRGQGCVGGGGGGSNYIGGLPNGNAPGYHGSNLSISSASSGSSNTSSYLRIEWLQPL